MFDYGMPQHARNLAIDRTRTFLTMVVLLHHAVLPYTHFGHTDPSSWIGLDTIVLATDSFFMAMFFFLSGLFIWPGLERKSPRVYLRERLLRLAVPGAVGALVLIPIAYYALAIRQNAEVSFIEFWWTMVTVGPWPSGPIWFLWVLLTFDLIASGLFWMSSKAIVGPINRISIASFNNPMRFWLFFVILTEIAYLPMTLYFGNSHWLEFGPFSIQSSRILLYLVYFFIGAGVGGANLENGLLSANGRLPKGRWKWLLLTMSVYSLMWGMVFIKRMILENPPELPVWYQPIYGTLFVLFSVSILFTIFAFFLHAHSPGHTWLDRMRAEAYGMFLVHYPIMLWIQYFLFDENWPAIAKATTAFGITMALSWFTTAALLKIPAAKRVL